MHAMRPLHDRKALLRGSRLTDRLRERADRGAIPLAVALCLVAFGPAIAVAQSQHIAREARSENRRYVLRIQPPRTPPAADGKDEPGSREAGLSDRAPADPAEIAPELPSEPGADEDHANPEVSEDAASDPSKHGEGEQAGCWATLYDVRAGRRDRSVVWKARLVNEYAPVLAHVSNDGLFVVTLDEHRRGGAAHAVVIYGPDGRVAREFELDELLDREDLRHVKRRGEAIEWLRRARCRFVDEPLAFAIKLDWGRTIAISLEDFELLEGIEDLDFARLEDDRPIAEGEHADGGAPEFIEHMLELLAQADPGPAQDDVAQELLDQAEQAGHADAARLAAEKQMLLEAIRAAEESADPAAARMVDELRTRLVAIEAAAAAQAEADPAVHAGIETAQPRSQMDPSGGLGQTLEADASTEPSDAGSAADLPAPPPPSLDEPVDYASWLMSNANAPDDPVVQDLRNMMALAPQDLELEPGLFDAALEGDPAALADPRLQEYLAAHGPALEAFRAASHGDYRGWPMLQPGQMLVEGLLPQLSPVRTMAKVSVASGKALEAQGRYAEAADAYLDVMRAGGQFGGGVTLIESLVGTAMESLSSSALLDMMASDSAGQIDYADLAQRLDADSRPTRPMHEMLQFERAMYLDIAQRSFERSPDSGFVHVSSDAAGLASLTGGSSEISGFAYALRLQAAGFEGTVAAGNAVYDRMTQALSAPFPQRNAALGAIEQELATPDPLRNPLVQTLIPSLTRASELQTRGEAQRRATRLVAELQALHQRTGAYPDSLAELPGWSYSIDPFSNQPFRYVRTADGGFQLYSIGRNAVDDGGAHDPKHETGDTVYWPRPAKNGPRPPGKEP